MNLDSWWGPVERARAAVGDRADDRDSPDDPLPAALGAELARLSAEELVEFGLGHLVACRHAHTRPLWNAAHLIEGGCGDDGFLDFRDGLVLLGREVFDAAVADPDTLAELPVIARMARGDSGWIGYQSLSGLIRRTWQQRHGDTGALDTALAAAVAAEPRPEAEGTDWDPEDADANRRHLPRLAALFED